METKNVIYELRTGKGLSQEELAEKLGYHFDHEYVAYEVYEY